MIKTLDPNQISQPELHGILLTAVAPRPICFASTVNAQGQVNLSPFSYFNVFSSNPPVMIFSPARSGRDNSLKHSHENVKEVPEVVINIVNHDIVEQMSLSSTAYDKGVDEFVKAGLTAVPSEKVRPPRVGEAPVEHSEGSQDGEVEDGEQCSGEHAPEALCELEEGLHVGTVPGYLFGVLGVEEGVESARSASPWRSGNPGLKSHLRIRVPRKRSVSR